MSRGKGAIPYRVKRVEGGEPKSFYKPKVPRDSPSYPHITSSSRIVSYPYHIKVASSSIQALSHTPHSHDLEANDSDNVVPSTNNSQIYALSQSQIRPSAGEASSIILNTRCLGCHVGILTFHTIKALLRETLATVDLDECIKSLYKKNLLAESVIEAICAKTKELLMQESNVVHIQAPVTVVGDIHGQFFDLIEIFKIGGWCPDTNYLFLGKQADSTRHTMQRH